MISFAQSTNDASWKVLNEIFGIDGPTSAINDTTHTAFKAIIYHFNLGLLSVVIFIYAFIVIIGTINTARDGTFLGKNWDSYWIPIRSVFGSMAAIPVKSGFCFAQYLVFMALSTGVYFADYVWQSVNNDVANKNLPPVISSDISSGIKDDIGTFMLANFAEKLIEKSTDICTPIENYFRCTMPIKADNTPVNMINIADSIVVSSANNFASWQSFLNQGMNAWSVLDGDHYQQVKIQGVTYRGKFNVYPPLQQESNFVSAIWEYISQDNKKNLPQENVNDPKSAKENLHDIIRFSNSPLNNITDSVSFELMNLSDSIINGLENKIHAANENARNANSKVDTTKGWWDADQEYLNLDKVFSTNLEAFYKNFQVFDQLQQSNANSMIKIDLDKVKIKYYLNNISTTDLVNGNYKVGLANSNSLHYSNWLTLVKGDRDNNSLNKLGFDMSKIQDTFTKAFHGDNQRCIELSLIPLYHAFIGSDNITSCRQFVDAIVPSSMSFRQGRFLFLISNLLSSEERRGNPSVEKECWIVISTLKLLAYLRNNQVSFLPATNLERNVASPASQFISTMLAKMSVNDDIGQHGIMEQIYNIGNPVNPKGTNVVDNHFSMMQQMQGVGLAIIKTTISSLFSIYNSFEGKMYDYRKYVRIAYGGVSVLAMTASAIPFTDLGSTTAALGIGGIQIGFGAWMLSIMSSFIWLPIIFFVLITLFGIGVLFALIIPLTPFILFWAGKIAWLLLVIEALIAAPIVALGIVYPQGHEVFGKAETGIQIMLNVVLRPVLMVVGLLAGIVLTYVIISFSADGFHNIITQISAIFSGSSVYVNGTFSLLCVLLYASFISIAFNKCFSLIYLLPDKVMQWVGHNAGERSGVEDLQELKSSSSQNASGLAQSGTQTEEKANQAQTQYTETSSSGMQSFTSVRYPHKSKDKKQEKNSAITENKKKD
ncbi:DotA/TraY family protein [Fangia hongkongensis]|uniref:DotA/TraY family protein n=1 Tax=Fangia hongkongensis TaxID=270495 RepID=UPI00036EFB65|nr:DotA/TraY family protein [Fangia hongkongensis]MBK2123862.1 DotA/TraY family protein [Fangia hongkongensis]